MIAEALTWVQVIPMVEYPNGDRSQYLDLVFRCSWVSGDPYPADGETTDAAWFPVDALPSMSDHMRERIRSAVEFDGRTRFER